MKLDDTTIAVTQTTINRTFLQTNQRNADDLAKKPHQSIKENKEAHVQESITAPSPDRILFNKLAGAIASAHLIAQQIRSVDNTMAQIEQNVGKMSDALDQVVKSYPPFPAGSSDRVSRLRQFSSLRQMIDQLTIPPRDEDSPEKILGDAKSFQAAGDWEINAGSGSKKLIIRQQPFHTGQGGLDIPDLPPDAGDEAIKQALTKLTSAQKSIQIKRQAFMADAHCVIAAMI